MCCTDVDGHGSSGVGTSFDGVREYFLDYRYCNISLGTIRFHPERNSLLTTDWSRILFCYLNQDFFLLDDISSNTTSSEVSRT